MSEIKPEWVKLRKQGWLFDYDPHTMMLGATHPKGGKLSIADFKQRSTDRLVCNQIGMTLAFILNDEEDEFETPVLFRLAALRDAIGRALQFIEPESAAADELNKAITLSESDEKAVCACCGHTEPEVAIRRIMCREPVCAYCLSIWYDHCEPDPEKVKEESLKLRADKSSGSLKQRG